MDLQVCVTSWEDILLFRGDNICILGGGDLTTNFLLPKNPAYFKKINNVANRSFIVLI